MTTTMQEFLLKQKRADLERERTKGEKANTRRVELLVLDIRELEKRINERKNSDEAKRQARDLSRPEANP